MLICHSQLPPLAALPVCARDGARKHLQTAQSYPTPAARANSLISPLPIGVERIDRFLAFAWWHGDQRDEALPVGAPTKHPEDLIVRAPGAGTAILWRSCHLPATEGAVQL